MAEQIIKRAKQYFPHCELFDEAVSDCENFGIKDKGSTTIHQYLVLY